MTDKLRFLPLRMIDEEIGIVMDRGLRTLDTTHEPKSLKAFCARDRLIHWAVGDDPTEILQNLSRVGLEDKPLLPVVTLHRDSQMEAWTETQGIPAFKTPFQKNAFIGFHPVRLTYRIQVLAFEQPVIDTLSLLLFTYLRESYRSTLSIPLETDEYSLSLHAQLLETDTFSFTQESIPASQGRMFAASAELIVGTFTYHVPSSEILTIPIRFVFEDVRISE